MIYFLKKKAKHPCGFILHKGDQGKEAVVIKEALKIRHCAE